MSYPPLNYTAVSGNYPLRYQDPALQNLHGKPLLKIHKCRFCDYTTVKAHYIKKHIVRKHPEIKMENVQSYGLPMEIGNAGIVYQHNYPLPGPAA